MTTRAIQLVLHYDGTEFAGWQRQPSQRTVQGVLEEALQRLAGAPVPVTGAGRTDAGVHARGQAAGVVIAQKWEPAELRRALNALLPSDVWVEAAFEMDPAFHARYSAIARRYSYRVGTSDASRSPFRRRWEHIIAHPIDRDTLGLAAAAVQGEHCFIAFAVRGTAPAHDDHRCTISSAAWHESGGALVFEIEANRFLHHMVRFLVGTMLDTATGRRPLSDVAALLSAASNDDVSPPAPAHALCLERVTYPDTLYRRAA
ncbi:MAG TPA: tRNA pseudouridine(38-40) synthase TruA [Gemmatimonadaceae bacterium]|nr:tRNA pseudouridine(38-40) synthase TruA [Gemmatimonadaceae bacterium]